MKNITSRLALGLMLFSITLSLSCASSQLASVPALENRTLRISLERPGLEYSYLVCVHEVLGICTKHEFKTETYDLTDQTVRDQLINMGFVVKVREKP